MARQHKFSAWGRKGAKQGKTRTVAVTVRLWRTEGGYCATAQDRRATALRKRTHATAMVCGGSPRAVYAEALRRLARKAE